VNRRLCHHPARTVWLISLMVFLLSCNLINRTQGLQATISAVNAQQTRLAQTAAAIAPLGTPDPQAQPALQPTPAVPPATSSPTPPETVSTAVTVPDLTEERLLKSARILLFEDMSASRQIRLVKEALDEAGYFYLDVGSAKGWFKTQLLSGVEWDLVIAAAEAEREFGGEFFEYIDAHLERGAGAIIENWDLDAAPEGRARPLLERCGVAVQGDWFEPDLRIFYWTAPAHPIFNQPNQLTGGLRNAAPLWRGDVGDLLQIDRASSGASAGEPVILASVNPAWSRDHGLLVTCLGGRLILQTFRSHEYHHDDMVALWQNYIYQALSHHFAYTQASLPTPAATYLPVTPSPAVAQAGPTPGPDYTFPHPCGEALTARLFEAPRTQKDLFEHHAQGTFMILRLELENQSPFPVQVWDQDYTLQGRVGGRQVIYQPHAAATGYLYIDRPSNLIQGLIQPGETWRTSLAFDIDPGGEAWELVVRPGSEFSQQVCQASLPLER
jgi:hypothetical protein